MKKLFICGSFGFAILLFGCKKKDYVVDGNRGSNLLLSGSLYVPNPIKVQFYQVGPKVGPDKSRWFSPEDKLYFESESREEIKNLIDGMRDDHKRSLRDLESVRGTTYHILFRFPEDQESAAYYIYFIPSDTNLPPVLEIVGRIPSEVVNNSIRDWMSKRQK